MTAAALPGLLLQLILGGTVGFFALQSSLLAGRRRVLDWMAKVQSLLSSVTVYQQATVHGLNPTDYRMAFAEHCSGTVRQQFVHKATPLAYPLTNNFITQRPSMQDPPFVLEFWDT
eukprot:gnl/Hemi2/15324_TR5161_c0_g1_i1.p1 gnl/Hemi2/15324_TR5161_c0_g1~~gnl/Hemi2/15324_TR5161_c0_g1_i1.p1  ORF type:complete len:116 (-),score=8.53 gnl/Hemi2/15324_TR5161_c0_g1_i1:55-402(-)